MTKLRVSVAIACLAAVSCSAQTADPGVESDAPAVGSAGSALRGSCSDEDERYLRTMLYGAEAMIRQAWDDYDPNGDVAQRYFGQGHDETRVRNTLANMVTAANSEQLTFMCDGSEGHCGDDGIILWVLSNAYATGDRTIHVCSRYWDPEYIKDADDSTHASAVGGLVHELAHLGGAWWEGYGEQTVLDDAASWPFAATMLGESYRYYVMYLYR